MAISVRQLLRRHGALVAAVTAAAVGVTIAAQYVLHALIDFISVLPYISGVPYGFGVERALLVAVPFAIGYFLSLWIIAPIAAELRIGHVIARAVLATGVASTVVFIVNALIALVRAAIPIGVWMPGSWFDFEAAAFGLEGAFVTALHAIVAQLPLGVLGGVFLWLWRKDHPPKRPLSGLIDEV